MTDRELPMREYRRAGLEITRGNAEVYKSLWSRRDDVTLANPFGPPVRGWQEVSDRLDLAASNYRDGRDYEFENIATVIAVEMAHEGVPLVVIQRQLGHSNLGITSVYLQGIDNAEIINTVHARRGPMIPVSTGLRL